MTVDEAINHAREYMRAEANRIPFGEITVNVTIHKNDVRKVNYSSTEKVQYNPSEGPRHDNHSR